jgi:hypothetical protein
VTPGWLGEPTVDAWRQWVFDWDAGPDRMSSRSAPSDGTGEWQTAVQTTSDPDGATGHHSVTVAVAG